MGGLNDIVVGLAPAGIAGQAPLLTEAGEVVASGEQLVHVGLVAGVEDDGIARRVEDPVQGHGELDHAEVGAEMTTGARDLGDKEGADLVGQSREVAGRQGTQIRGFVDALQQGHARPLVAGRHDDGGAGRHRSLKQWCNT